MYPAVFQLFLSAQTIPFSEENSFSELIPGSHLEVFLMTVGPGDVIWERFSHNALVIRDDITGTEIAYNWGIFDFNESDFIPRLLKGRMRYWMASYRPTDMIESYRRANRNVWIQKINLTPSQRLDLQDHLRKIDTEANRYYQYDYYRDNCSTRIRDALDHILSGQIRVAAEVIETENTYRWHTARLLEPVLLAYSGIQFVVGNRGDKPISAWDEMFLPLLLQRYLEEIKVHTSQEEGLPLLGKAVQVVDAQRDPVPDSAPNMLIGFLLVGIILGSCFTFSGWMAGRGRSWAAWLLVLTGGGWSFVVGLLGSALMLSWLFTDHFFWGLNENALQANPMSLLLFAMLFLGIIDKNRVWARRIAITVAVFAIAGLNLQILPGLDQVNGEILALTVPAHLGLALGVLMAWPSE